MFSRVSPRGICFLRVSFEQTKQVSSLTTRTTMSRMKHKTAATAYASIEKQKAKEKRARILPRLSFSIRCDDSTADIDIRNLADVLKSLEPKIPHPHVQVVQMIADSGTGRIRVVSGRIMEALARVDAVCEPVYPDAEQVVAVACWQIIAAVELERDVVFGGTEGRGHAGAVAGWGKDGGSVGAGGIGGWRAGSVGR